MISLSRALTEPRLLPPGEARCTQTAPSMPSAKLLVIAEEYPAGKKGIPGGQLAMAAKLKFPIPSFVRFESARIVRAAASTEASSM